MDDIVIRSLAKWPDVPAVYGWLSLDRRGRWRIKGETIANAALREFIARNYQPDERGRWFFQNGPQRVFVQLAYTPLVVRYEGGGLIDHCGRPFAGEAPFMDEEGSVLFPGSGTIALLDDRDLVRFSESPGAAGLPVKAHAALPREYGFAPDPRP